MHIHSCSDDVVGVGEDSTSVVEWRALSGLLPHAPAHSGCPFPRVTVIIGPLSTRVESSEVPFIHSGRMPGTISLLLNDAVLREHYRSLGLIILIV